MIEEAYAAIERPSELEAGIYGVRWEIEGPLIFEDEHDKEEFRNRLRDAFEFVTDGAHGVSFASEEPQE